MALTRIVERVTAPFAGTQVDRDKGIIRGVKLCGLKSENQRDYSPDCFRRDFGKYEGVPIYADHSRERSVGSKLGWIDSPRVDGDGTPRGDAHLLKSHPLYAQVMEAAERNPSLFGFSHVATCHTSFKGNREQVEGLNVVESVDLVAEPATTKGLFEGRGKVAFTVKQLVEWVVKSAKSTTAQILKAKKLAEMDEGGYAAADMGAEPAAEAEPEDAISNGFEAALVSVVKKCLAGEIDDKAAIKKIKKLLVAHGDAIDDGGGDDDDGDGDGDGDGDNPSSESKKKKKPVAGNPIMEALDVCERIGFRPDRTDLDVIASANPANREKVAKRLKESTAGSGGNAGGEKPRSAGRDQTAKIEEAKPSDKVDSPPSDGKAYAKWVSE